MRANDNTRAWRMDSLRVVALAVLLGSCATAAATDVQIMPPARPRMQDVDRVLVAGFIAPVATHGGREIDLNVEVSRFLRMELRSRTSRHVIEAEPLRLERGPTMSRQLDPVFTNAAFWRRVGEEYGEPLILTGEMTFKRAVDLLPADGSRDAVGSRAARRKQHSEAGAAQVRLPMKEIKAYIREEKMADVVRGLRTCGARAITLVRVVPVGTEVEPDFVDISAAAPVEHYTPILKLELVCDDEQAWMFAKTIRERAHTGKPGDGVIFVSDVQQALHIRTGQKDEAAL